MKHTIHQLAQGTPQWHAFRAKHFTASESAAMLGISTYQTRSDLLKAKATGYTPEVDAATQRRFNAGHDAEAGARQIAEQEIGQDLYPITASRIVDGLALSASYDGATMSEEIIWEHKLANVGLLESLSHGVIPEQYHPQLEQQLLVSGAEKALFMASSGDRTAMEFVWYTSNPDLRARLIAGWKQFAQDLATYVPPEVIVAPVAEPQMGLPAVVIKVEGSIALVDNLPAIGVALNAYIAGINKKPESDQDFANLEATVKHLKAFEEALGASEENALAQVGSVDAMRRTVALYRELASSNRLLVDKLVKAEKENRRTKILSDAVAALHTHMKGLQERTRNYMPTVQNQFQNVIKGLKSLDSMKDKVAGELARCKIEANAIADKIQFNLALLDDNTEFGFLFPDATQVVLKATDDFTALVNNRIAVHKAEAARKEEETRARIQAEEQAKAEKAAREKLAAEQAATAAAEKLAKEQADAAALAAEAAKPKTWPNGAPMFSTTTFKDNGEPIMLDDQGKRSVFCDLNDDMEPAPAAPAPALTHAQVVQQMPATVRQAMAPAPTPATAPTMTLGEISTRLGFNVTSVFLASLGFEATTVKAAKLFHEEDFPAICRALIEHIESICEMQAA